MPAHLTAVRPKRDVLPRRRGVRLLRALVRARQAASRALARSCVRAAAWLRRSRLPEHKIQSDPSMQLAPTDGGGLTLQLQPVPKFLGAPRACMSGRGVRCRRAPALSSVPSPTGCLRGSWAPSAFVVSFKLETDEELLVLKAHKALTRYGVHAVVRAR